MLSRIKGFVAPIGLGLAAFVVVAVAQQTDQQSKVAELKQSLAQNQAALRQYTWVETTKISLKGEVKKEEQKQCFYGADGKVQKTPLGGAPPQAAAPSQKGGGRLKKKVAKEKKEEMQDYMQRVAALVHEYVPPDPQKLQAAAQAGNVSIQPAGGVTSFTIKNYLKPGDSLAVGFDSAAKKMRSYAVQSYLDNPKDDPVSLTVTFADLQDGTTYPEQSILDAKSKNIRVMVTNSGYRKTAP